MPQQLSSNTFTTAKWIVSPTASDGTHTTIAGALTSASSGDTIFIRPGTYTENPTLKAGVNLAAYDCDALTPNVIISGKCTFTGAGTVSISGIRLQTNSDFLLAITGSAASIVNLKNCHLNCTNNTGISYTTSSGSAALNLYDCAGDLGTTGIGIFTASSAGTFYMYGCEFTNSGVSLSASTTSSTFVDMFYCRLGSVFTTSSTGTLIFRNCIYNNDATNTTFVTTAGTGSVTVQNCILASGTASCISIGAGTTSAVDNTRISSSNADPITGAGTLNYLNNTLDTGAVTNVSTQLQYSLGLPLNVANGGTGAVTLTGVLTGNGTSAVTANTVTQHGIVIGGASNAVGSTGVGATGTVLIGTTGADPSFSATPTLTSVTFGSGTALSVYQEGTWTPTLDGAVSGTTTYTAQTGYYTKIGNLVTCYGQVAGSAATGTGNAIVGGLPFTVKNQSNYVPPAVVLSSVAFAYVALTTYLTIGGNANATTASLYCCGSGAHFGNLQMQNTSFSYYFTFTYQV